MAEQTYRPSCVVNLTITFEDKLRIKARQADGSFTEEPLVTNQGSGTHVLNRVPSKCTVHFQGHTTAATWNITFPYRELPIDPRTVKACKVEIHLGTVSDDDFSSGMQREVSPGIRRSILQTRGENGQMREDNLLLIGVVDNWTVDHGESGAEVHIDGRDLRGLLLDSPLVSTVDTFDYSGDRVERRRKRSTILDRIRTKGSIVEVVQSLLKEHEKLNALPDAEKIRVIGYPGEWPRGVILSPGFGSHVPRNRRGASGSGGNGGSTAHSNLNFWDVITNYCNLVGAIPRFVGRNLEIRYAPSLYQMVSGENERIPFAGGQVRLDPDGTSRNVRALVYGRDIESMKISRKYAGHNKPKTVRVVTVNQSGTERGRGAMMESVWPPRTAREARREGVNGTNRQVRDFLGGEESSEVMTIRVGPVSNQQQLDTIARSTYEQIGRNEITGEVSTSKLTSFGGTSADPDMLRLRVGDPLELLVDTSRLNTSSPIVTALNRTAQLPLAEAVEEVRRLLRDENLARVIVTSARGNIMGILRYYRVSGVDFEWSDESVTIKTDIHNYWTPRWDYGEADALHMRRAHTSPEHVRGGHAGPTQEVRAARHPRAGEITPADEIRRLLNPDSVGEATRWRGT